MRFFLGSHMPHWLGELDVSLCINRNRLVKRKTFPRARAPWALDSGAFTELKEHGRWRITAAEYAAEVRRYHDAIGQLVWAGPQDWMCEPWVIFGRNRHLAPGHRDRFEGTRLARGLEPDDPEQDLTTAVRFHQEQTVANFLELKEIAPDLPIMPVVQGWTLADYKHCLRLYKRAGIDLAGELIVGVGSVCRRQATAEVGAIMTTLADRGLRLHGYGVKALGIAAYGHLLVSSDSLAWSTGARYGKRLPGCTHRAAKCQNCPRYALQWRSRIVTTDPGWRQLALTEPLDTQA
ncbi:hypothetical protein ABZ883_35330 [Streptomyces sp. NPDC046977]|uniref:deazapurine DNA modification protein DpdA family protein n=1 Tax=Streptomyces sp. NPDC046977 TaxID=3154703 RepID=UPI003403EA80